MNQGLAEVISTPLPSPAHKLARRAMAAAGPEAIPVKGVEGGSFHLFLALVQLGAEEEEEQQQQLPLLQLPRPWRTCSQGRKRFRSTRAGR